MVTVPRGSTLLLRRLSGRWRCGLHLFKTFKKIFEKKKKNYFLLHTCLKESPKAAGASCVYFIKNTL